MTPAEHLCLPNANDVREGIVAFKIAAHAADIAKGLPGARDWDDKMAHARKALDWEAMFDLAIDPEKARRYRAEAAPECDLDYTPGKQATSAELTWALSTNLGFGGHNAALAFKKYVED